MATGDLITLEELLDASNELVADLEPEDIRKREAAISASSSAILIYADRDFGSADTVTEAEREYEYDGSGYLEIDDAATISLVKLVADGVERPLDSSEWRAVPFKGPVYTDIRVPPGGFAVSPEMGFKQNLDVYYDEHIGGLPFYRVTGRWGWPVVPPDVKRACIWTALSLMDISKPQAESIANYSRSTNYFPPKEAIPEKAQALLAPYIRLKV